MDFSISLVIASHNGAATLPRVFAALEACGKPVFPVEYLLVDNASTDETGALMEGFLAGRKGEVIREDRPGKSFALNSALEKAGGTLVAFLDDDALPCPGWFEAWRAAHDASADAGVLVGQVRPRFPEDPPEWLAHLAERGMACACTNSALRPGPCDPAHAKGLNWAIRRAALGEERFDERNNNLLRGGKPVGGQDTEMARRLARMGHGVVYVPEALAHHVVRPSEMSARALFDRYRRIGRGVAAQGHKAHVSRARLALEIGALSAASGLAWLVGARRLAAANLTRTAARIGRWEMRSRSGRETGPPDRPRV